MTKKIIGIILAVVMLAALAVPALAASNSQVVTGPTSRIWQDGFGFHCNIPKGNGATAVEYLGDTETILKSIAGIKKQPAGSLIVEKGDQKDIFGTKTFPIGLERVGATTLWNLQTDNIICKTCGRNDWVTYSNNSGVINGKNIQAHHPPLPPVEEPPDNPPVVPLGTFSLVKTVEGQNIIEWAAANNFDISLLSFVAVNDETGQSFIGELTLDGVVVFGDVPVGKYTVTETLLGIALDIFVNEGGVVRHAFFVGEDGVESEDVSYISGKDFGTIITAGRFLEGEETRNWVLPDVWNNFFAGSQYSAKFAELLKTGAKWVWDAEDTYRYGIAGSTFMDDFTFVANEAGTAKAYFAADNVAVIYLNDKLIGYTTIALRDELTIGDDYDEEVLGKLDFSAFDGRWSEGWNHLYEIEIPYVAGENTIKVIAANSVSTGYYNEDGVYIRGNTGTDNDTYNFTNNPCGLIFGFTLPGATFDNELVPVPPTFEHGVSFNKVKYGGVWPVDVGEFAFDLYIIVDGKEVYHNTYYTDFGGNVLTENLPVGSYVFREVSATYHPEANSIWRYVWFPQYPGEDDGLYFEITEDGVEWKNGFKGTLNNILYGKHDRHWVNALNGTENPYGAVDGGWIIPSYAPGTVMILEHRPANCNTGENLWFKPSVASDYDGFMISLSGPLGHGHANGFVYTIANAANGTVWVRCGDCDENSLGTLLNQGYNIPEGADRNPNNINNLFWPAKVIELGGVY